MEETTEDPTETESADTDPDEPDPESAPASDPPPGQDEEGKNHELSFDPEQIENDPAYEPTSQGLKDLKGG